MRRARWKLFGLVVVAVTGAIVLQPQVRMPVGHTRARRREPPGGRRVVFPENLDPPSRSS